MLIAVTGKGGRGRHAANTKTEIAGVCIDKWQIVHFVSYTSTCGRKERRAAV